MQLHVMNAEKYILFLQEANGIYKAMFGNFGFSVMERRACVVCCASTRPSQYWPHFPVSMRRVKPLLHPVDSFFLQPLQDWHQICIYYYPSVEFG